MELGLFFPDNKRGLSKKGSFLKFEQSFNIDMERMLVKKAHHVIKSQDVNKNSILISILKGFFKTIIERIRKMPKIDKFGYQRI